MDNLLIKIQKNLGNLTCPNCKKTAIISINGGKVRMNIDCPKEQDDFCSFFDRLDDRLRKHTVNPAPKKGYNGRIYLYKAGIYYKIGRTKNLERREREIKLQLPFKVELIHHIKTNNPIKTEKYWHDHFATRRQNGEWFCLTNSDVEEFKRINFM